MKKSKGKYIKKISKQELVFLTLNKRKLSKSLKKYGYKHIDKIIERAVNISYTFNSSILFELMSWDFQFEKEKIENKKNDIFSNDKFDVSGNPLISKSSYSGQLILAEEEREVCIKAAIKADIYSKTKEKENL